MSSSTYCAKKETEIPRGVLFMRLFSFSFSLDDFFVCVGGRRTTMSSQSLVQYHVHDLLSETSRKLKRRMQHTLPLFITSKREYYWLRWFIWVFSTTVTRSLIRDELLWNLWSSNPNKENKNMHGLYFLIRAYVKPRHMGRNNGPTWRPFVLHDVGFMLARVSWL